MSPGEEKDMFQKKKKKSHTNISTAFFTVFYFVTMPAVQFDWEGIESGGEVISPVANVEMLHGK